MMLEESVRKEIVQCLNEAAYKEVNESIRYVKKYNSYHDFSKDVDLRTVRPYYKTDMYRWVYQETDGNDLLTVFWNAPGNIYVIKGAANMLGRIKNADLSKAKIEIVDEEDQKESWINHPDGPRYGYIIKDERGRELAYFAAPMDKDTAMKKAQKELERLRESQEEWFEKARNLISEWKQSKE